MYLTQISHKRLIIFLLALCLSLAVLATPAEAASGSSGFVYVMTNQPSGNSVIQYRRAADGTLTRLRSTLTGGLGGTGNGVGALDPLGSQDSLVLNGDGSRLLAVNAGSNELSALRAGNNELTLVNKVPTGGQFPNSVALYGNLVYVLNAHGVPNITGFRLQTDGSLVALAGSTRALPGGSAAAPHDINFSSDGTRLIVTEDQTNQIDIFDLDDAGLVARVRTQASVGAGPFGFRFVRGGALAVTEAMSNALSSYRLTNNSTLSVISASVPNGQMASCWISVTRLGHAFVSNTASGTISSYQISASGNVSLAKAVAGSIKPGAPIDSALSKDNQFLYVEDSALGRVVFFRVQGNSLAPLGSVSGLPTTLQGIAAQ